MTTGERIQGMIALGLDAPAIARALEISLERVLSVIDGQARRDVKPQRQPQRQPQPVQTQPKPQRVPSWYRESTDADKRAQYWAQRGFIGEPSHGGRSNRFL